MLMGLVVSAYITHSMRRPKVAQIYKKPVLCHCLVSANQKIRERKSAGVSVASGLRLIEKESAIVMRWTSVRVMPSVTLISGTTII
jgi:general stress protein 26